MKKLKELYREWDKLSSEDKKLRPNLFIDIQPSIDIDTLGYELVNNLERNNIINFNNDDKFCYYRLNKRDHEFSSFKRFHNLYKNDLCKFNISYSGLIIIDLTAWSKKEEYESEELKVFIEYLNTFQNGSLFAFVSTDSISNNDKLFNHLSKEMFLERIDARDFIDQKAINYFNNLIKNAGYYTDQEADTSIRKIVKEVLKNKEIDVFKRLKIIFNKITYQNKFEVCNGLKTIKNKDLEPILSSLVIKNNKENDANNIF